MSVEQALKIAEEYGFPVFPCRERPEGKFKAKSPLTEHGFLDASTNMGQIERWWSDRPEALVGVPTGKQTHLLVIDIDPEAIEWYRENFERLACGRVHRTQRGHHLLYRMPDLDIRNSAGKIAPGVDIRAEGGYVIWWPAHGLEAIGGLEELSEPPSWVLDELRKPEPKTNVVLIGKVGTGRRNDYLFREACKLRHLGWSPAEIETGLSGINQRCQEPLDSDELAQIAASAGRYEAPPDEDEAPPRSRYLEWAKLGGLEPPPRLWFSAGWLHSGVTLLAGRGGSGKSLIGQQLASALVLGRSFFARCDKPVRTLTWACEDEHDELWRRQVAIANDHAVGIETFDKAGMVVDERLGLENTLFAVVQGHTVWTVLLEYLRQQVNDLKVDVLFLDNVSHTFGGNENDRHHVTTFINGLVGLCIDRPFAVVLYGHLAKSPQSEYSGSTAWENAVRMRWYLGKKLPDQKDDEPGNEPVEVAPNPVRYLCKRKTNYSEQDYVRFEWDGGIYRCASIIPVSGLSRASERKADAEAIVLETVRLCQEREMNVTMSRMVDSYLPKLAKTLGLANGMPGPELAEAAVRLLGSGKLKQGETGKTSNRHRRFGLVLP